MNVYLLEFTGMNQTPFDPDSVLIVAESENQALAICQHKYKTEGYSVAEEMPARLGESTEI